jgi:hypothetical protein
LISLVEVELQREREVKPRLQALYDWLMATHSQVSNRTATAKAIDYALKRWPALVRYCDDVFERLPTHPYSRISELLPTQCKPGAAV